MIDACLADSTKSVRFFFGFFYAYSAVRHRQFLPCALIAPRFRLACRLVVFEAWVDPDASESEAALRLKWSARSIYDTVFPDPRSTNHGGATYTVVVEGGPNITMQHARLCHVVVDGPCFMPVCNGYARSKSTTPGLRSASSRFPLAVSCDAQNLQSQTHNAKFLWIGLQLLLQKITWLNLLIKP